jgi:hypothetical protein
VYRGAGRRPPNVLDVALNRFVGGNIGASGRAARARSELPGEQAVGQAVATETARVKAAKVMGGTDGDEVVILLAAALGTIDDVMRVQVTPGGTAGV